MGSGLKMWLQIMWFLASSKQANIVVLDEPDIYMHPDLQRKLAYILSGIRGQTILTTHSVELLSEFDPEEILIINKRSVRSDYATRPSVVQDAIDRMGTGQNIQLIRLWNSKRFLLVEGKDISLLSRLQLIQSPDSEIPLGNLPSQEIGGWDGWQRAIGAAATLVNSAGERLTTYCLLDRDYHTEEEIDTRYRQAKQNHIELHVWSRKELENYFICPRALSKAINASKQMQQVETDVNEVNNTIAKIAEELKNDTFDRLSEFYHSLDKKGGPVCANKRARERLDNEWNSIDKKLGIISGKKMLAKISEWSQKNYMVSLSARRIARYMEIQDLDSEVRSVISSIERGVPFSN